MINEHVTIDNEFAILRSGISYRDPSEASCYKYVVLDRAEVEARIGCTIDPAATKDNQELAQDLTGWSRSHSGPGRSFQDDPSLKVFGRRVLITQRCGLDV